MSLINCPDCGKEISDMSLDCIHCGCPIEKEKKPKFKFNKKNTIIIGIVALLVVIIAITISNWNSIFPHTIQNIQLMQLLEYTTPYQIKKDLGNEYVHNTYSYSNSSSDDYENILIDDKYYSKVEISYNSTRNFERIYLDTNSIWTRDDYETLIADLIKQFGTDYDYDEDDDSKTYTWDLGYPRRIICTIFSDSGEEGKYWIRINSFHE